MDSSDRDNSPRAILERYKKATVSSILASDPVVFDSLRDIPMLLEVMASRTLSLTEQQNINLQLKYCAELDEAHPDYVEPFWKRKPKA